MIKKFRLFILAFFAGSLFCAAVMAEHDDFGSKGRQVVHSRNLGIDAELALDLEDGLADEWKGGRGGRGRGRGGCGGFDRGCCGGFDGGCGFDGGFGGCGGFDGGCGFGGFGGCGFGGFWPWWGYALYWPAFTPWFF